MTERCQMKFRERFENQNYVIYVGIFVASLAVLYVYRFHFATIAYSYGLGCLACYYGLNSNVLDSLVNKLKCHSASAPSDAEEAAEESGDASCGACGARGCPRHAAAARAPWRGLRVHKQLDLAIENFYNAILEQFIAPWHARITARPHFAHELRAQLRRASAALLRRAARVNYARFLTERLIPCALRHYALCAAPGRRLAVHPAAASRAAELRYLRSLTRALMPHLLDAGERDNPVFAVLVREIFAGWVLLSLTDVLADPYILNALVILATGDETMAPLPPEPDYRVEFLADFARTSTPCDERARLLRVDLDVLLGEPPQLYAFMQHIKTTPHLPLLQFYKDIKQFQTKLLDPALGGGEQAALCREAAALLARHRRQREHDDRHDADRELRALLEDGADIKRLQTSPLLFAAARSARAALDAGPLPRFLHSEEFYKILIGSRIPTGYQKQHKRQRYVRPLSALRPCGPDGLVLDSAPDAPAPDGAPPDDADDDADILAYLDRLAADELADLLSTYKVSLTNVETRPQAPPRSGTVRVFTLAVYCGGRLWDVERSEHDFHLLRSKLIEFHGERLLADLCLPSRRDNSPDETLRYKYEDFLQRALQQPLLQGSALLRLFLSAARGADFARDTAAAALAGPDLGQLYQAVTHRLRKEKGQHLDGFLRNFLLSADMERYQALKQGAGAEEAREAGEEREAARPRRRDVRAHDVFGNNLDVAPELDRADDAYQDEVVGFAQCLMYLLRKVVRARGALVRVLGALLGAARRALDRAVERLANRRLARALCERRLAHLIRLGHELLFGSRASTPRMPPERQRSLARAQLLRAPPPAAALLLGAGLPRALDDGLRLLQHAGLNKQLVYNLLDLCVMELFPELSATDNESNEPKS